MNDEEILSYFDDSWYDLVYVYMKYLKKALKVTGTVYPEKHQIFRVFSMPLSDIKLVILGQDPYHGHGQATGLAFDCNDSRSMQPSVRNMFKEIKTEFPKRNYIFKNGSLERWFEEENIFLINSALSVLEGTPGSLLSFWSAFTDATIQYIADYNESCVFLLMGKPAQTKSMFIGDKNRIVTCVHPSPMSASRGFFGSNVFKTIESKIGKINWQN